ncbi:MAG: hypothetical protein HYT22_03960 [Candidatus Niyogibacteria bacterium]|nr:hypothetical protein [Candidatus Niyogibacteria bacterium]
MTGSWLWQSVISMLCLIVPWLSIGFFDRNFQVRPDVFLIWYFLGVAATSMFFGGAPFTAIAPSWKLVGGMLFVGLTFGAIANLLIFRAVAVAPNPGLPLAIVNVSSVAVFVISALLARWIPDHFSPVKTDLWSATGVLLTIIGASLIAIRR